MAPSQGEPVERATAKPVMAPITIMPSTPRFKTPDRSTTSSPMAAISSGVAAVAMVMRIDSSILFDPLECRGLSGAVSYQSDAIMDEHVTGENEEQQHALECTCNLVRHAD